LKNNAQEHPGRAWQPLTFGGVARYAHEWMGRLIGTALLVAALASAAVVVVCCWTWVPVIDEAVRKLPMTDEIRGGRMSAPGPLLLAESPFLSIRLNPENAVAPNSPADLQVELARNEARFRSMFGASVLIYQPQWTIGLNPIEREPWWGAWKPAALAWLWVGTMVYLLASWVGLALLYFIPARIVGFYADRDLTLIGAWKLCVAALMPGAVFLSIAILLYGKAQIRLLEVIGAFALHFIIGWIFVAGAILRLPPVVPKVQNPFEPEPEEGPDDPPPEEKKNPFSA
jgi:hypothetical protein